jgi:hypothetical protein
MEISDVRRRVREAIADAKRAAAERRARQDEAARAWADVLDRVVLPVSRQLVNVLKAEGHPVQIFTPADSVRIGSDSRPTDFVELALDTTDDEPTVVARMSQGRGRDTLTEERAMARGSAAISGMTEEQVVDFLAKALAGILVR